jgi:hypothetical protein
MRRGRDLRALRTPISRDSERRLEIAMALVWSSPMSSATLRAATVLPQPLMGAPASAPARKGAFRRFLDRLIEARTRKAEAEIRLYHRHLLPDESDRSLGNLPFVR